MRLIRFATATLALLVSPFVIAQDDQAIPVTPNAPLHILTAPRMHPTPAGAPPVTLTIPNYSYSVVSPTDGKTYTGQIIGANPTTRPTHPTVVPTIIVPVKLVFQYSSTSSYTFDPMATDPGCLGAGKTALGLTEQSPLFNDHTYTLGTVNVGNTQYIDAFQRAEFWGKVSVTGGANYHTLMGITPMPEQVVTVTSANSGNPNGTVYSFTGQCGTNTGTVNKPGYLGVMDISFWDAKAQTIITNLGIQPNQFVLFLFYNSVISEGTPTTLNNCCVLGYHDIVGTQTYGNAEFEGRNGTLFTGVADTSVLAHELGEWVNDPTIVNATPAWGHIGQVSGCQGNFEVGDPLSGTLMPTFTMPNGFTYHLQELAFFGWFFRTSPSGGVNGWYSMNDTFTTGAGAVCN